VPIIPLVLVNGAEGIGTGWSTSVPPYNPHEIVANLRTMMAGQQPIPMKPWYKVLRSDRTLVKW
jgi:DNA topoisomerase-2